MTPADRTMFEIYREADYARRFRVVYFTELDEHNKEQEINRAMAGEHFFDGFLADLRKDEGKRLLNDLLARLNQGESLTPADVEAELSQHKLLA